MVEAEWLACRDVVAMLQALRGAASTRRLQLFACALGRTVWTRLSDERSRLAIELAEQAADRELVGSTQELARHRAWAVVRELNDRLLSVHTSPRVFADPDYRAALSAAFSLDEKVSDIEQHIAVAELGWFDPLIAARFLRDIFGNPFRPVSFPLEWRTDTSIALASRVYESRDFGALPILADALQDAGCDSDDILDHCRGLEPHVRGCWVLDLVLGKE